MAQGQLLDKAAFSVTGTGVTWLLVMSLPPRGFAAWGG